MKTQKKFVISGMFNRHKILGICLILAMFFAPTAQAALTTMMIDPGTPGEGAQDFIFDSFESDLVQVLFTDNKTIEWNAGSHFWLSPGTPGASYIGFFLDLNLDPIRTAAFAGKTVLENDPFPVAFAALAEDGVFRGMLFSLDEEASDFDWEWDPADRPTVGVVPIPAAVWLLGGGLIGLLGLRKRFKR